jgi:hypothetical protein
MFFIALLGWTVILIAGCAESDSSPPRTLEARIIAALQEMLRRNDSPFAIIEHGPSQKFVQFAGSAQEPLTLDLPAQSLTPSERARAQQLFASLGGMTTESGFQLDAGRDAQEAARVALRVFREVFQLPEDAELTVNMGS